MKSFGEKIKEARINKGLTQKGLAELIGVAHNSISGWENDKNRPDPDSIELLCGILDMSPNYLLSVSDEGLSPSEKAMITKYKKLDAHGRQVVSFLLDAEYARVQDIMAAVQGGTVGSSGTIAVPLLQDALSRKAVGTIPVQPDGEIKKGEDDLIALPVTNDAMAPFVHPGDKLIVRQQTEVNSGDIAVVLLDGVQVVCKQVIKEGENLRLVPLNKRYEDMVIHQDDIRKKRFEIIGRVVKSVQAG